MNKLNFNLQSEESDVLACVIDALSAHVAITDSQGIIVQVNRAWKDFMLANGGHLENYGIGLNYAGLCSPDGIEHARSVDDPNDYAARVAVGIDDVLSGRTPSFQLTYPCHGPNEQRWFLVTITPLKQHGLNGAIIAHENVTTLMQHEESISAALVGTVEAVSGIVEARDPYTAGHQLNVAQLAVAIGEQMRLEEVTLKAIQLASSIHDIGKITVPSEILTRPGRLSELEMALIRTHSQAGYDMLKNIPFPWPLAEIALQHHERYDGSGYPNGIRGENIHIGARVIAVADTVDAMTSHRPYRPSQGINAANRAIRQGSGSLYDPAVVEAYFSGNVQQVTRNLLAG